MVAELVGQRLNGAAVTVAVVPGELSEVVAQRTSAESPTPAVVPTPATAPLCVGCGERPRASGRRKCERCRHGRRGQDQERGARVPAGAGNGDATPPRRRTKNGYWLKPDGLL